MGPTITPMPQTAMAGPCLAGGLISISTIWDIGTNAAPNTPCSRRAATICPRLSARPQSAEATVKPITEARNTRFWPKRSTIQPVRGVAMAAATM